MFPELISVLIRRTKRLGRTAAAFLGRSRAAWLLIVASALVCSHAVRADGQSRLTGGLVISQIESAAKELDALGAPAGGQRALQTSKALTQLSIDLKKELGTDVAKPVDDLTGEEKGMALRAYAAAQRAQTYLALSAKACTDKDFADITAVLDEGITALSRAPNSGKEAQPLIQAIETADHKPIFAVRKRAKAASLFLVGQNLYDPQCDAPKVVLKNSEGRSASFQPTVVNVSPGRVELSLPADIDPDLYMVSLSADAKTRFLGCRAMPAAIIPLDVMQSVKYGVSYQVTPVCRVFDGKKPEIRPMPTVSGVLPAITDVGMSVSQPIQGAQCDDLVEYRLSATVATGDQVVAVPEIKQSAFVSMTIGLPGGLTMAWEPATQIVTVRLPSSVCEGIY